MKSAWKAPHIRRGHLLVQRDLHVTFKGTHGEEMILTLVSDGAGDTRITEAILRNPEGVHFTAGADDSNQLAVVALLHTAFARATEELVKDIPARPVRFDDGITWVGLTDSRGRFGSDELVAEALRSLDAVTSRRRVLTEEHLADVAEVYLAAVEAGDPHPTKAVADQFARPRQTAATWVMQARKSGLIPPAVKRN